MKRIIDEFPNYEIDSDGYVINIKTKHLVQLGKIRNYHYVDLRFNGKRKNLRLGRLIANTFISNPENKPQVNHIDGNSYNDNVTNLEWCTVSENQFHKNRLAREKGVYKKPYGKRKHLDEKIEKVFLLRNQGKKHKEIAKELEMGVSTVTHILLGSRRSKDLALQDPC